MWRSVLILQVNDAAVGFRLVIFKSKVQPFINKLQNRLVGGGERDVLADGHLARGPNWFHGGCAHKCTFLQNSSSYTIYSRNNFHHNIHLRQSFSFKNGNDELGSLHMIMPYQWIYFSMLKTTFRLFSTFFRLDYIVPLPVTPPDIWKRKKNCGNIVFLHAITKLSH